MNSKQRRRMGTMQPAQVHGWKHANGGESYTVLAAGRYGGEPILDKAHRYSWKELTLVHDALTLDSDADGVAFVEVVDLSPGEPDAETE